MGPGLHDLLLRYPANMERRFTLTVCSLSVRLLFHVTHRLFRDTTLADTDEVFDRVNSTMPAVPATTRPRSWCTPRRNAACVPTRHHRTGTIKGLRGYGGTRKASRPIVNMVVGQGRPNVGICGYAWPPHQDQSGYRTSAKTMRPTPTSARLPPTQANRSRWRTIPCHTKMSVPTSDTAENT